MIGEGGFGVVLKGKINSLNIAIKKFNDNSSFMENFLKEIGIIRKIRH